MLGIELHSYLQRIEQFAGGSAEERLLAFLAEFPKALSHDTLWAEIQLPFSFGVLAQWLGVSPSYLCRLLKKAQRNGLIRRRSRCLWLREAIPVRAVR